MFLGYASPKGHALIDRRLYLPKDWAQDGERRKKTHIPDEVAFATKPKIGIAMVEAALEAGVPCSWVLGDSVYGCDKGLRVMLEKRGKPYVLAVRSDERLLIEGSFQSHTVQEVAAGVKAKTGVACQLAKARKARGSTTGLACVSCVCKRRPGTIGC